MNTPSHTPSEFASKMQEIFDRNDTEDAHAEADELMTELLKSLGYERGMKIFDDAEKWYA